MKCPYCQQERTRVIDTSHDNRGGIRRRRVCGSCLQRFTTYERPILATPLLVKRDGTREEFSRDKLMDGIRLACSKRPISAEQIEHIVGEIESDLQQMGKSEIPSRLVGDGVTNKLRELDEVAYIRYAIVYMQLNDLQAIKTEINRYLND
ncbi:MAG: transcriptional regulator NrdR [Candidatus Promineifilaceae bacterium]